MVHSNSNLISTHPVLVRAALQKRPYFSLSLLHRLARST